MSLTLANPLDTSNVFRIRHVYTNRYLVVGADGIITLLDRTVPSTLNDQWVATPTNPEFSIPGATPSLGYFLKNLGTKQYLSSGAPFTLRPNPEGHVLLTTVPSTTTTVTLVPYAPSEASTYFMLIRRKNPSGTSYYASPLFNNDDVVLALAHEYTNLDQYNNLGGSRVRWVFEAIRKAAAEPTPLVPSKSISPIVKKDPLPKGLYRIRSFTGNYLLTMPVKTNNSGGKIIPYVSKQVPSNEYQRWQVTRQENDLYTISNSGNGLYLAAPSSNLIAGALLLGQSASDSPKPFEWNIQSVSGVFFFVGVPTAALSMGFADYHADDSQHVSLTTNDNAASQIWLFETVQPLTSATFSYSRLLSAGAYIIELSEDNSRLVATETEDLALKSGRDSGTHFQVSYKDEHTAKFTLSYKESDGGRAYIVASPLNGGRVEITDAHTDATEWAVLRLEPGEDVFHIIRADVQDPQRAISSRRVTSRGKSYFAIDSLAKGEVMQMFRFHPVV
ncbi:hypothetical protein CPC08DRAFT_702725 [Agrocybe pediades]|nr:hypothetical protein CPC08DRAFT_702725 [Agrocybe pediades]